MLVPSRLSQTNVEMMIDVVIGVRAMIAGEITFISLFQVSWNARLTWPDVRHPNICFAE